MTLSIGLPFEFSADRRGMPTQGVGNVLLRVPLSPSLPDIKAFSVADLLIAFHECPSLGEMDVVVASSYPTREPGEIALII